MECKADEELQQLVLGLSLLDQHLRGRRVGNLQDTQAEKVYVGLNLKLPAPKSL